MKTAREQYYDIVKEEPLSGGKRDARDTAGGDARADRKSVV